MKDHPRQKILLLGAILIYTGIVALTGGNPWQLRAGLGVIIAGIFLWITTPLPLPHTALLLIVALTVSGAVPLEVSLSGFSSNALFLIIAGFMIAAGVNSTSLFKRFAYSILIKCGATPRRSLLAILIILQATAFVIPSIAVKVTLPLPAVMSILKTLGPGRSNVKTALLLGVAYGVSITSLGLLPAAIANAIAADLIARFTGHQITYVQWAVYNLPLSLILLPVCWQVLLWVFPPEVDSFPGGTAALRQRLAELGPVSSAEKRCLVILALVIGLWLTEPLHGWPTAIPALIGAFLMAAPMAGVTGMERLLRIDWGTVIIAGTSLSLGNALIVTGATTFLAGLLFPARLTEAVFSVPILTVVFVALFTQIYHLFVGNVATVVVSILPVFLELSAASATNFPAMIGFTTSVSALCGFFLVIQTMPNVIIFGTGLIRAEDFLKGGLVLTICILIGIVFISAVWWPLLGYF